jgi:hypothetical protein
MMNPAHLRGDLPAPSADWHRSPGTPLWPVDASVVEQAAMKVPRKATQYCLPYFDDGSVPAAFDIPMTKKGRTPASAAQSSA